MYRVWITVGFSLIFIFGVPGVNQVGIYSCHLSFFFASSLLAFRFCRCPRVSLVRFLDSGFREVFQDMYAKRGSNHLRRRCRWCSSTGISISGNWLG